jgi:hypothetical protein
MSRRALLIIGSGGLRSVAQIDLMFEDYSTLSWTYNDQREEVRGEDFFECLIEMRNLFESRGLLVACNGSRYDVYPSRMSRQMSNGLKAYVLTLGRQASKGDVVEIFDETEEVEKLGSVKRQREYYDEWVRSLV